jgi:hypothetical protein
MDIDSALTFFGSSLFIALGIIVIGAAVLVVNNLFMKFWKPVPIWTIPQYKFVEHPINKTDEPKL